MNPFMHIYLVFNNFIALYKLLNPYTQGGSRTHWLKNILFDACSIHYTTVKIVRSTYVLISFLTKFNKCNLSTNINLRTYDPFYGDKSSEKNEKNC
jgi:hypothetical protein